MMKFEDLHAWKRAARLSADVYRAFQGSRDYGFRDQITRSSLSIASNIAEGYERDSMKEKARFLSYAKGSCGELRTQIFIGMDVGFIEKEQGKLWAEETRQLSRMLYALMQGARNQGTRTKGCKDQENTS